MLQLRQATTGDIDFVIKVDLKDEGVTSTYMESWGEQEYAAHRIRMVEFLTRQDRGVWVYEDTATQRLIGLILYLFRNRHQDSFVQGSAIPLLDIGLFPADGNFCEVYQLWVDPDYRRRGLATQLKQQMESQCRRRSVTMIYTHTEERNRHVVELNRKLGYHVVRRGPIWDDIIRISLIKDLA